MLQKPYVPLGSTDVCLEEHFPIEYIGRDTWVFTFFCTMLLSLILEREGHQLLLSVFGGAFDMDGTADILWRAKIPCFPAKYMHMMAAPCDNTHDNGQQITSGLLVFFFNKCK